MGFDTDSPQTIDVHLEYMRMQSNRVWAIHLLMPGLHCYCFILQIDYTLTYTIG
jgi:hypothetical protein